MTNLPTRPPSADRPSPADGAGAAVPIPSAAAPSLIEQNCRCAFATWDGVVSLGHEHRMSEADKAYWREKYRSNLKVEAKL